MNGTDKTNVAIVTVVTLFTALMIFSYIWDALVRIGWLHADTISEAIHEQLEKQVSLAFLMGYLLCHLIRG